MPKSLLKIIVAEDSELQRVYLCRMIDALGYEAIPAQDGQEALELVQETEAQIVISDLQMPKLDGIALTQEIRNLDVEHYIHIIMLTGSEETEVRQEALNAGVDDFLTKGGSPAMLKARVRTATRLINHAKELADRTRVLKEYNDRIQEDLRAAAMAQRQLLPDMHEEILGFDIASIFVPSSIVSGDMFSCFALSDQKLGFYAVDVSGHGVHASLLSVAIGHLITPEYFRTKTLDIDGLPDPAALVSELNTRFSAADNDDYFTMFCGVIDTSTGRLDYCQAGYPSPFYVQQNGTTEAVGDGGFPVGMMRQAAYENHILKIEVDGALVICSDAASEAENCASGSFGDARVSSIAATLPSVGISEIPNKIVQALNEWRAGKPLEDDLTVMALKRKAPDDTYNTL